jgi:hypothetical protein
MALPYETPAQAEEYRNQLERRFKTLNPSNTFDNLAEATSYWNSAVEKPGDTTDLYIKSLDQIWSWDSSNVDKAVFSREASSGTGLGLSNTSPFTPTADYHPATKLYVDSITLPADQIVESSTRVFISQAQKDVISSLAASSSFKGTHVDLTALQTAYPTANAGDYADVDTGAGSQVERYIWDNSDSEWIIQGSGGGTETASSIKTKYESNPNTEVFTTAQKTLLENQSGVNTGDQDISGIASNLSAITDLQNSDSIQDAAIALNTAKRSYPSGDETKLAGIEAGAQVNPTAGEIKSLYEGNSDTEAFTTAEKDRLANSVVSSEPVVFQKVVSSTKTTLTSTAGSITWTGLESNLFEIILTEDSVLQNATTPISNATYQFLVKQDVSGLWTLGYGNLFKFKGGQAPAIDLNPNSKNLLTCIYDGEHYLMVSVENFL